MGPVLVALMVVLGSVPGLAEHATDGASLLEIDKSQPASNDVESHTSPGVLSMAEEIVPPAAAALPPGTRTATTELVAVIETSAFAIPSPDPSGIVWLGPDRRLMVGDAEVNETPLFAGSNLFAVSLGGALVGTGVTTPYSNEPTGLAYDPSGDRLFISDDDADEIYEIRPGRDGRFGSDDDVATSFDTRAFGSNDPEGVTFDPVTGDLFVTDGRQIRLYRIDAGPNGLFDGVDNDDVVNSFDLKSIGSLDPEGIGIDPERGVLAIVDQPTETVFEVTKAGALIRAIDISEADAYLAGGITLAPGSLIPTETNLYVVDRGVDNGADPNQNDGRILELRVIAPPGDPFVDDNDSVHEAYINALAAAGITVGCNPPSNTLYCPGNFVTRAQMASFLQRAFDLPPATTDWFVDDNGSVHEGNIDSVAAAGITLGCNPPVGDRFCPNASVTREQMASFLVRALGLAPVPGDAFVDDNNSVHEANINAMAAAGITLGCNPPANDRYCPQSPVTREQMASFLGRALGLDPLPVQ